jgi:hypothetical protein
LDKYFPIQASSNAKEEGYDSEIELFFEHLPAVWGAAFNDFKKDLIHILDLKQSKQDLSQNWTYKLSQTIEGIKGGLLYLDISEISDGDTLYLSITWVNDEIPNDEINEVRFIAHKGINLIPLEASPRWLLAGKISSLTVKASDANKSFIIRKAQVFDRTKI